MRSQIVIIKCEFLYAANRIGYRNTTIKIIEHSCIAVVTMFLRAQSSLHKIGQEDSIENLV